MVDAKHNQDSRVQWRVGDLSFPKLFVEQSSDRSACTVQASSQLPTSIVSLTSFTTLALGSKINRTAFLQFPH